MNKNSLIQLSPMLLLATMLMFYGFFDRSTNSTNSFGSLDLQTSHVTVFAVWVGLCLATYPLYLLHQELGNRVILTLTEFGFPVALPLVTGFVLCVALSIFISLKIEPPLRKMILRRGLSNSA